MARKMRTSPCHRKHAFELARGVGVQTRTRAARGVRVGQRDHGHRRSPAACNMVREISRVAVADVQDTADRPGRSCRSSRQQLEGLRQASGDLHQVGMSGCWLRLMKWLEQRLGQLPLLRHDERVVEARDQQDAPDDDGAASARGSCAAASGALGDRFSDSVPVHGCAVGLQDSSARSRPTARRRGSPPRARLRSAAVRAGEGPPACDARRGPGRSSSRRPSGSPRCWRR